MKDTRLFLVGFMGCGKSTFGRKLGKALGYAFIDMDTYIEQHEKKTIPEIFAQHGDAYFRHLETRAINALSDQVHCVIATGGGAPCSNNNMESMNAIGQTIYLKLPPEELAKRLELDPTERPVLLGKTGDALVQLITDKLKEREAFYLEADYIVDANKPEEVISQLTASS